MNKFQKWKKGMQELNPVQILHAKLIMSIGIFIGMAIALSTFVYTRSWGLMALLIFLVPMQGFSIYEMYKQWKNAVENMKELQGKEDFDEAKMIEKIMGEK